VLFKILKANFLKSYHNFQLPKTQYMQGTLVEDLGTIVTLPRTYTSYKQIQNCINMISVDLNSICNAKYLNLNCRDSTGK